MEDRQFCFVPSPLSPELAALSGPMLFEVCGLELRDWRSRVWEYNGRSVELTKTESRMLLVLAAFAGEVVDWQRLRRAVWDDDPHIIVVSAARAHIQRLRGKLGISCKELIVTVSAVGYKINDAPG